MPTYHDFSEVEDEIRQSVEPVIYKYRTWEDLYHKRIITENEAWFAHPFTLNDPYDVRPPYNIIDPGIDWDKFRAGLENAGRAQEPNMPEDQLQIEIEKRLQQAKSDPIGYFSENRRQYILEKENYDRIGVFSCCTSGLNEPMWAHYGNNHCGFAIGFDTVEIARALNCSSQYVIYDDTPIDYIILGDNSAVIEKELYQKSKRWIPEEEFRFVTAGIGVYRDRAAKFQSSTVKEILVGTNTSPGVVKDIVDEALKSFPGIPIYRVARQTGSYGFQKVPL